ncbi:MAG: hypothetical protein ABSB94_16815 [Syntrophorhabdales bacterium]|jgi:hypothetical protein
MKEKVWMLITAASLFVFVTGLCLAEQPKQKAKPAPQPQRQQAQPQGQQAQPQRQQAQPQRQQAQPQRQQAQPQRQQAQPQRQQAGPQRQPGQSHPADSAQLQQRLRTPVTRGGEERAVAHYREERARFVRHSPPMRFVAGDRVVLGRMRIVPGTYHYRRTVFYDTYGYVPAPYIYRMYPRYGVWDAAFLGFMVERAAEQEYALMYYNHRNEAEMIQWRQDMDGLAMDNADLRAKLAFMDQQVAQLQGTPVNRAYVPPDAQDVALSPDVVDQLGQAGNR